MMYEYSKFSTVISFWLLAALFIAVGWGFDWRDSKTFWIGLFLRMIGVIFAGAALVTSVDWFSHRLSERMHELATARTIAVVRVAGAIKGLTGAQMDLVETYNVITIEEIVSELSPRFVVRVPGSTALPFEIVEEYLQLCKRSDPYLYPERDYSNWRHAQLITKLIVQQGWAAPASGPLPAKLLKPLPWVAERFGVVVEEVKE